MIPADYVCRDCAASGVKLWRKSASFEPVSLLCATCTVVEQKHPLDLSDSDQCWGRCPAVPDLRGSYWGYTSVPAEGVAWWDALPVRLDGEWPVKGGKERWLPYKTAMSAVLNAPRVSLRRVDFGRSMALVFVASGGAS